MSTDYQVPNAHEVPRLIAMLEVTIARCETDPEFHRLLTGSHKPGVLEQWRADLAALKAGQPLKMILKG